MKEATRIEDNVIKTVKEDAAESVPDNNQDDIKPTGLPVEGDEKGKVSYGLVPEEDQPSSSFEIREKTFGLANPKIIPATKENLGKIMLGIFSLDEIKELENQKEESQVMEE